MVHDVLADLVSTASSGLLDILDNREGPLEPAIRSEIFGAERFAGHGRSLGVTHRACERPSTTAAFFPRLRSNIKALKLAHAYLELQAANGFSVGPAGEWLLDNFHLIDAQLKAVREGVPRSYYRELPVLQGAELSGLPRVYGVAWAFVAHTDSAFDDELLTRFLMSYQETCELTLSEVWAMPTTLRVVLIENLRRLAERIAADKGARELARLCNDASPSVTSRTLGRILALMESRGVRLPFLIEIGRHRRKNQATPQPEVDAWLAAAMPDLAAALAQESVDQAADNASVSNALTSLRAIAEADWPDIVAHSSMLMQLMLGSTTFGAEDTGTRDSALHAIERLARKGRTSELSVARQLLHQMQATPDVDAAPGAPEVASALHTAGHWLSGDGRPALVAALGQHEGTATLWRRLLRAGALPAYLGTLLLGTVALVAWLLPYRAQPVDGLTLLLGLMMVFPASEAMVALINRLICESARPRHIPRFSLAEGLSPAHRVMVAVPAMLTTHAAVDEVVHRLQLHYLANPEHHTQFALLSDYLDAEHEHQPEDIALLHAARLGVRELNRLHPVDRAHAPDGPRFIVLHRPRSFSPSEQCWIGWERKRGKLELLVGVLAGDDRRKPFLDLGEESRISPGTAYLVTLDTDTQLPPRQLRELVGVAAHPRNRPCLSADGRRVVSGYGILQPRVATLLPRHADATPFHWLFAGQSGVDPYSAATSEVYQDLFGEGTFMGKGLLDVHAMHAVLTGRLPAERVLSHDLLEGSIARCAAVTDITLLEDAPFHADVAASRVHRWIRGDWQLLPFLLRPGRYPFPAVNRWKMFDNLRRSLVAPMSLGVILVSLAGQRLPLHAALALLVLAISGGPLISLLAGLVPRGVDVGKERFYYRVGAELARAGLGALWLLGQLFELSLMALDAIVRALWRMAVSRRRLLEWTTAQSAQAGASADLRSSIRRHWRTPVLALATLAAFVATAPDGVPWPAVLLCLAWALTPLWSWFVSRSPPAGIERLTTLQRSYLAGIARDTWRFFERCVTQEDSHLPPDNLQVVPYDMVAHRTSPTNVGLYLSSMACARQFGWIGTEDFMDRLQATLGTLESLPVHRGHFYNWYDTRTLQPMLPMYVSTVDSGNLCGHLLTVAQGCLELVRFPYDNRAGVRALDASRERMAPLLAMRSALDETGRTSLKWLLADHRAMRRSNRLDAQARKSQLRDLTHTAATERLRLLAARCQHLAWQPEFGFLFNERRRQFHVGFGVADQQLDASFYDLLASESRLTSLLAIAKGDVTVRHWGALGRPFFAVGIHAGLRSWSGSMFEYLMPSLILDEPDGSALHEACRAAVIEQMKFAKARQVPWGISESAYARVDDTLAFQYAPQGVPVLALRRTAPDELVIAPYATALAAMVAPSEASDNYTTLEALGARWRFGFIEALDYSPSRQLAIEALARPDGRQVEPRCAPVATFMAHHQGMTIVALANVLLDNTARRWTMQESCIEAWASLLHETAPREVLGSSPVHPGPSLRVARSQAAAHVRSVRPGSSDLSPTHLLSNGRYSVSLRPNGAGWSRWGKTDITRWRDDALRDAFGSFFYLRTAPLAAPVSLTQHPACDPAASYDCTFHGDRVVFGAAWAHVRAVITVWVSPEDDAEFRQVELVNLTDQPLSIELLSAFEPTLCTAAADSAHPAFANLFLRAEYRVAQRALVFERKARLETETDFHAAHFLVDGDQAVSDVRVQTDRRLWLGRNGHAGAPLAAFGEGAGAQDTGLDPVSAFSVRLEIAANAKARLTFVTAASDDAGRLSSVIDKYRQPTNIKRASLISATLSASKLRDLHMSPDDIAAMQMVTTALAMTLTRPPQPAPRDAEPGADAQGQGACDRQLLWRFGISGDRPLLLAAAGVMDDMGCVRSLVQALTLWGRSGVAVDLVVIDLEAPSYFMSVQRALADLRHAYMSGIDEAAGRHVGGANGLYNLSAADVTAEVQASLRAAACLSFAANGLSFQQQVLAWSDRHHEAFLQRTGMRALAVAVHPGVDPRQSTHQGEFVDGGRGYHFAVDVQSRPARPWTNVLANPDFGSIQSEAGGGYSWAVNSKLNQLTAWSNDIVSDTPGEWLMLQDEESLAAWSLTASAWADPNSSYLVSHGQGRTTISHQRRDLAVSVCWCVDPHTSVKQIAVTLVNRGQRPLRLRLVGIVEWMMGSVRSDRRTVVTAARTEVDAASASVDGKRPALPLTVLLATQRETSAGFGGGTGFFALVHPGLQTPGVMPEDIRSEDWTCDRRECFDAQGAIALPRQFRHASGQGLDPCAAIAARVLLAPGAQVERVFLLGYGASPEAAASLAGQAAGVAAASRVAASDACWDRLLGAATVSTPDPLFDAMTNRWLLYQTIASRLYARAGFYQAGGATGFRDQLQDTMALAWAEPSMLRAQIVQCAARQFPEGDVQHWWHAPLGAGVRTHFSDDLLWLGHACVRYLDATGDIALLDQRIAFIEGPAIAEGAEDAYYTPTVAALDATCYEHVARAIDKSLASGVHGIPLMGTGDWNDGMNRVGNKGRGESIWLGWFLVRLVADFAPIARSRGDSARAARWEQAATAWVAALRGVGWDGGWFKRAFFDDGQALGSAANSEARIDLVAQAWAVLSGAATPAQQAQCLSAVEKLLVDHEAGLIRLLDPPLQHAVPSAGYIQAYPPGVRENGGQYSHAAVWALMAQAEWALTQPPGHPSRALAYDYFTCLSPAHRARDPLRGKAYEIEPYVMAGDVYSQPPYVGRGGWSWYTGSAGLMHRAAIETIFGLHQDAEGLRFRPCLPPHWERAELTLRRDGSTWRFVMLHLALPQAREAAAFLGAKMLAVGERLEWTALGSHGLFVIAV